MKEKTPIRVTLRLPADVHEEIASASSLAGLSLNQEIVSRLKETLRQDKFLVDSNEWINNHTATYDDLLALYETATVEVEEWKEKDYSVTTAMQGFEAVSDIKNRLAAIEKKLDK